MGQPLVQSLVRLAQMTFNANKYQSEELFNESINKLKKLLSQMSYKDIPLNKELMTESMLSRLRSQVQWRRPAVTYVSICETQDFHLCVFGLRHNRARIPLHNHPDMYGLIRVVFGCVSISNYTALPIEGQYVLPNEVSKRVERWQRDLLIPTLCNGNTTIDSQSNEVCFLTPNERNYHEVVAVDGPAAILDVLAPPYKEDRECHYFKVIGTVFDQSSQQDITWLLEDPLEPDDYWCDSLPYVGPNIHLN